MLTEHEDTDVDKGPDMPDGNAFARFDEKYGFKNYCPSRMPMGENKV